MNHYIVYHQTVPQKGDSPAIDCPDGICAAWIAWRGLLTKGIDPDNIYVLGDSYKSPDYSLTDPPLVLQWVEPRDEVIMVDFAYPRPVTRAIAKKATLILLDHHVPRLQDISQFMTQFNLLQVVKECGATLAWKYFFPDEPAPWFLQSVRDRDINSDYYEGLLPESEAIAEQMAKGRRNQQRKAVFEMFDTLCKFTADEIQQCIKDGLVAITLRNTLLAKTVERAVADGLPTMQVGDWIAPLYEITDPMLDRYYSLLGTKLHQALPDAPFVVIKTSKDLDTFHLRSHSYAPIHLGELAKTLGGGGHPHAAGFKVPTL